MFVCLHVYVYMSMFMYVHMLVYTSVSVCKCVQSACAMCVVYVYVNMCLCVFGCVLQRLRTRSYAPNSVTGDTNYARYGPDTLAIRRLTHEMIQRSVPVRVVKTRR